MNGGSLILSQLGISDITNVCFCERISGWQGILGRNGGRKQRRFIWILIFEADFLESPLLPPPPYDPSQLSSRCESTFLWYRYLYHIEWMSEGSPLYEYISHLVQTYSAPSELTNLRDYRPRVPPGVIHIWLFQSRHSTEYEICFQIHRHILND